MKRIKEENIIVGDFIYIIDGVLKRKDGNRRFILKILTKRKGLKETYFWKLKNVSNPSIFDPIIGKGICRMREEDWEIYDLYKLNKKEIEKFKRLRILENLK